MCNNGKTIVVELTPYSGGTPASTTYLLQLDHYTCGGRKLCTQESYPVTASLQATPIGAPVSVGNNAYCQEVLVSGSVTYMPYTCGCQCNVCPVTDNIYTTICVPCSAATTPTLTVGTSLASPTNVKQCCNVTNCVAVTTSINVATAAA